MNNIEEINPTQNDVAAKHHGLGAADLDADGIGTPVPGVNEPDGTRAHFELTRLAARQAENDFEQCRWLVIAERTRVFEDCGYGSMIEYLERLFGYKPKMAHDRIRVAKRIGDLPLIAAALRDGRLNWSAVRELTRVAVPETEEAWLHAVQYMTSRQIEAHVSGRSLGSKPSDPPSDELRTYTLSFEVRGETKAIFRDALAKIRTDAGDEPLDDDRTLMMMARAVLGGPVDEGRANYQIALTKCEACGRVRQNIAGESIPVGPEIAAASACDAQYVPLDSKAETPKGEAGAEELNDSAHVGHSISAAIQDIPPRIRRLVLRRDGRCCVVPGCRHQRFLDLHHLRLRSEGGGHDPDFILTICWIHHTAIHEGRLLIAGSFSMGLIFRHADGTTYGGRISAETSKVMADAFLALRSLGFRETESKLALAHVRAHVGPVDKPESAVAHALAYLRRPPDAARSS